MQVTGKEAPLERRPDSKSYKLQEQVQVNVFIQEHSSQKMDAVGLDQTQKGLDVGLVSSMTVDQVADDIKSMLANEEQENDQEHLEEESPSKLRIT